MMLGVGSRLCSKLLGARRGMLSTDRSICGPVDTIPWKVVRQVTKEATSSELAEGAAQHLSGPRLSRDRSVPKARARTCVDAEGSIELL
jgi:hypothetical protein